jgi:hypothetical protein
MRIVTLSALLGLTAICSTALADPPSAPSTPSAPADPSTAPQAHDPHELICHDRVATGSRLAYARDCHTRAEWDVISRSSQDFINTIQRRALNTDNPPGASGH